MDVAKHLATAAEAPDLLESFVDYAKDVFVPALAKLFPGGTAHIGTVAPIPDEIMPSHVGAFYLTAQPETPILRALVGEVKPITAMYVSLETAVTVAAVARGRTAELPDHLRRTVLRQFKTQLKFVLHEAIHSVGPPDIDEFQKEAEVTARAGLAAWKEAITERVTQRNLDNFIKGLGLDKGDPMLLEVDPMDTGSYVGTVEAADVLVRGLVAMIPGADYDRELLSMAAKGSGRTGLRDLVSRALGAQGVHHRADSDAVIDAVEEMVADTFTKLQDLYKRTISQLDNVSRGEAKQAMVQLRERGNRLGRQMLGEVRILAQVRIPLNSRTRSGVFAHLSG